jgi:FkbM family methyltransferase
MMMQRLIGDAGSIVAVDANPENCIIAAAQAHLNACGTRVTCVHAAASSDGKQKHICYRTNSHVVPDVMRRDVVEVPGTTGDELDGQFGPFDVVKIDVEGMECDVLEGCSEILRRRPRLILEVHPNFMTEYGYGGSIQKLCDIVGVNEYTGTIVLRPNFQDRLPFAPEAVPVDGVSNWHLSPVDSVGDRGVA